MLTATQVQVLNRIPGFIKDDMAHRGADFTTLSGETLFELADGLYQFMHMIPDATVKVKVHRKHEFPDHGLIGICAEYETEPVIHIYLARGECLMHARQAINELCYTALGRNEPAVTKDSRQRMELINKSIQKALNKPKIVKKTSTYRNDYV